MKKANILIYQDYTHNHGLLYQALCSCRGVNDVGFCDAADIHGGILDESVALLVMPGGADLFYAEKLNGAGNRIIRAYVEKGGAYLGLCAGAYYGCAALDWARASDDEIAGPRELAFFPGTAEGPVNDFIGNNSFKDSWHAAPEVFYDDGAIKIKTKIHYNGGCVFIPSAAGSGFTVLARYTALPGQPAAIVECRAGAGKAILCGPHIENTGDGLLRRLHRHRNPAYEREKSVAEELKPHDTYARELWKSVLARCVEESPR